MRNKKEGPLASVHKTDCRTEAAGKGAAPVC